MLDLSSSAPYPILLHDAHLTPGMNPEKIAIRCPMKTILTLLAATLITVPLRAEDQPDKSEETMEVATERQQKLQQEQERAKELLEKKPVTYSGFLPEAVRAEKKSKFFSLRQPRNQTNDLANVSVDERTVRPRGFVLFRIGF
jgi:hypothetical protein